MWDFLYEAFWFSFCIAFIIGLYLAHIHFDNREEDRESRRIAREIELEKERRE